MLLSSVAVAAGGALGSLARFWLGELFAALGVTAFPWSTLVANVTGSFLIGVIATLSGPDGRLLLAPELRQFWMIGFCGGYTTFSSFSLQTLTLTQGGDGPRAVANVLASVASCLLAVWLGHLLAMLLNRPQGA
jgi:CrcB protein